MDYSALRERIIRLMGDFPEKCDLASEIYFREDCGDYFLEKVGFRSCLGEVVPAYILIPRDLKVPAPAVVVNHSHGGDFSHGKSRVCGLLDPNIYKDGDARSAIELCRRGFVTIAIDMKAFGERSIRPEDGASYERFAYFQELLHGSTLQARFVWDLSRTIDYLETRPEVDASRIGTVGFSMGGQEALFFAFFDPRVTTAISVCGVSPLRGILRDHINHNYALYIPGMLKHADMEDLLATIAPRALMIIAGEKDGLFPIDTVHELGDSLRKRYAELGVEDRFRLVVHPQGHTFQEEMREIAWEWFDRWLRRE